MGSISSAVVTEGKRSVMIAKESSVFFIIYFSFLVLEIKYCIEPTMKIIVPKLSKKP
jgi:hypothetical protein